MAGWTDVIAPIMSFVGVGANALMEQEQAESDAKAKFEASRSGYHPDPAGYRYDLGLPDWAKGEVDKSYQGQQIGAAYGQQASDRGAILAALDEQRRRAAGEGLISPQVAAEQQRLASGNVGSQLASAAGRYNPGLARKAQNTIAGMGQQMAGPAAIAAAQERAAAQSAYSQGLGRLRTQDIAREQGLAGLGLGWGQFGISDKDREASARRALEQARLQSDMKGYHWENRPGAGQPGSAPPQRTGNEEWDSWARMAAEERRKREEASKAAEIGMGGPPSAGGSDPFNPYGGG